MRFHFYLPAMDDLKPVTHLLVIDAASKKGIKLLKEGLHYLVIAFWQKSNLLPAQ